MQKSINLVEVLLSHEMFNVCRFLTFVISCGNKFCPLTVL